MKFVDFIKPHRHKVLTPTEEVHDIEFCIDEKDNLAYKMDDDPEIKPIGSAVGDETIVGDIRPFAGAESDIPDGWLPCFGQNILIENYRDLYDVIEDTYNDSTTQTGYFRLPDLRNRFIEGSSVVDGNPVEAGIPNIYGYQTWTFWKKDQEWSRFGAYKRAADGGSGWQSPGAGNQFGFSTGTFQASDGECGTFTTTSGSATPTYSNKVYGKSDTVQPPALKMIYIIRWKKANISNPEYAEDVVVGDIRSFAGTSEKVPTYWHICDGTELPQDEYPELFAVIGTKYNTTSTPTGKFALPNLINKFVEGSGDLNVGEDIPAGLPNITGTICSNQDTAPTGAFQQSSNGKYNSGNQPFASVVSFDASRSSDIYGKSDTVQPPAVKMLYIIRLKPSAINTTSEEVIIGDIRAFAINSLPSTWIVCRGQNVKQSAYPELFAVIGTMYNNSSTLSDEFGIPDLTGRFIQGALAPDGTPVSAGLPNIKGVLTTYNDNDNSFMITRIGSTNGVFTGSRKGKSRFGSSEASSTWGDTVDLDASKGQYNPGSSTPVDQVDSIFGKSSTVQPPAYKMVYAIRAKATNVDCILQPLPVGQDGDMLFFDGAKGIWSSATPVDITTQCSWTYSRNTARSLVLKVGKIVYVTVEGSASFPDENATVVTLPSGMTAKYYAFGASNTGAGGIYIDKDTSIVKSRKSSGGTWCACTMMVFLN